MSAKLDYPKVAPDLRRQAERRIPSGARPATGHAVLPGPTYLQQLVHELHVYKVELEMQNDNLHQIQQELQRARDRYIDLFDYAPVGFVTLDDAGCIVEANLTLVVWLGVSAKRLKQQPFARFVSAEDTQRWNLCLKRLQLDAHRSTCLLKLLPDDGTTLYARLHLTNSGSLENGTVRVAVVDISEIEYRGFDSLPTPPESH